MFFTCCGRRTLYEENESPKKDSIPNLPQNTDPSTINQINNYKSPKPELILQPNFGRTRGSSSSSSTRSVQSFYSCKSTGDEDYFSICSDSSFKDVDLK